MNERLKKVRKLSGLTQKQFGARLRISESAVSKFESGGVNPSDQTIGLICSEFSISEHWLRTGEGEMKLDISKQKEIAAFAADLMTCDDDFKTRIISALARFSEKDWDDLERLLDMFNAQDNS